MSLTNLPLQGSDQPPVVVMQVVHVDRFMPEARGPLNTRRQRELPSVTDRYLHPRNALLMRIVFQVMHS